MAAPRLPCVYLARPDRLAAAMASQDAPRLLDAADLAHAGRFRQARDRELATASRALQRLALAWAAGDPAVDPAQLEFARVGHRRPEVVAPPAAQALRFSVANTNGLVACAVSRDGWPGVDVEPVRAEVAADLVQTCLSPRERAAYLDLPAARRPYRFARLWTLKEAYLKACGIGLDRAPDHLSFELLGADERPRLVEGDPAGGPADRWWFEWLPVGPAHAGALCLPIAGRPPGPVPMHWVAWDGARFVAAAAA